MMEVPLKIDGYGQLVLVVPEQLEETGAVGWTFVPNLPGEFWARPYGRLQLIQPPQRNESELAALTTLYKIGAGTNPKTATWAFCLHGQETNPDYPGKTTHYANHSQGSLASVPGTLKTCGNLGAVHVSAV